MAYIYRHIRKDKNEVFYIGIGSDNKYKRAYSTYFRNKYWHHITAISEYEIEIILDGLSWNEACEKEKEFIQIYGRKDLNEGTLVNMTNGGDGLYNPSPEIRAKLKKPKTEAHKLNISLTHADIRGSKNPMYGKGYLVTGEKNHFYGKKHTEETLKKLKKPKSEDAKENYKKSWSERKERVFTCPHCQKTGGENIKRWHFNNCKK